MTLQEKIEAISRHGSFKMIISACMKKGVSLECVNPKSSNEWFEKMKEMTEDMPNNHQKQWSLRLAKRADTRLKFRGESIEDVVDQAFEAIGE